MGLKTEWLINKLLISLSEMVYFDVDQWIELARDCKYLPETDMKSLCDTVSEVLNNEPNIVQVSRPITVCGDIHGQFYDLQKLFDYGGQLPDQSYIFMGDFVDRGYYSLETLTLLLALKAKWPDRIILLRGNHESRQVTQVYGFMDETLNKYGHSGIWRLCCQLFDLLPLGALIDNEFYCVHGGLSPYVKTLDAISLIDRDKEIPHQGPFCDIMWSDPEDIESWAISPRGAGWLFGRPIAERFLSSNKLTMICRAHQLVNEGYKYIWDDKLVTVWSAPNYCYRCGNLAAILYFGPQGQRVMKIFEAVPDKERQVPDRIITPYFL